MYSRFTRSSTAGIWQAASLTFSTRTCDNDTRSEKTVRIAFHRQLKNGEFFNRQLGSEIPKKTYTRIHYHAGSLRGRRLNGRRKGRRRARKALEERTRIPRRSFWLPSPSTSCRAGFIAGGIRKRSFISTDWPTIHTNSSWKWNFSERFFNLEKYEIAYFSFPCVRRKTFWKRRSMISR